MTEELANMRQGVQIALDNNKFDQARKLLQQFCALDNSNANAWLLLGQVNGRLGQFAESEQCSCKAIALEPKDPEAHYCLALALAHQGKFAGAAKSCEEATSLRHDFPEAIYLLADMHGVQHNYDLAVTTYEKILSYYPDEVDLLCKLADALQKDEQQPHHIEENLQRAANLFQQALQLRPGNTMAITGLATILSKRGLYQQAYELIAPLMQSGKADSNILKLYGRLCRHFDSCKEAATLIEQKLADDKLNPKQQQDLWLTLGHLRDRAGEYDAAFAAYERGNTLLRPHFDPELGRRLIQQQMRVFQPDKIDKLPHADNGSELPVFILGMPRSGSTLLEQILAGHPQVYAAGEIRDIMRLSQQLNTAGSMLRYPESLRSTSKEELNRLAQSYLDRVQSFAPGARCITNKHNPNFLHVGLISRLFPAARIIHTRRDPLDTCLSCYFQDFVIPSFYDKDLEHIGQFYRQYESLMDYWHQVLTLPILDVQYEELVADMEGVTRQVIDFLGLEWDPACLDFHQRDRVVQTSSAEQVNRPLYTSSMKRWQNYESHLGPLKRVLGIT